jgi:hypothetical protein
MMIPILANDALGPFFPPSGGLNTSWPSPSVRASRLRGTAACFSLFLHLALWRFLFMS